MSCVNAERLQDLAHEEAFERFWTHAENWVEKPNSRRGGISGVIRTNCNGETVYIKKQVNHLHYSIRHPFGRPTALREHEALEAVKRLGLTVPDVIFCDSQRVGGDYRTILVTRDLHGYLPLEEFLLQATPAPQEMVAVIRAVAQTLAILHRNRWQHGALYPKHIFISRQGDGYGAALIDLEKMRRRLTIKRAGQRDLAQLSRHQRCWNQAEWSQLLAVYQNTLVADLTTLP
ncbi:MAG: lipopolysaccharide kinase InaA family protein [Desulfuromonadales bacterium]|nr:lipopolysaccharide kinase InaA family protein [Desulfuromonadales bacterium]